MMSEDVYDVWIEPARNLTDAELSRQEFYRERIGFGLDEGLSLKDATKRADELLRDYDKARNAARSHGDGAGAIPCDAVDGNCVGRSQRPVA
jgi:hypothetical protein